MLSVLENLSIIFYKIVYMSIKASIIAIIIFILLRILKNKICPKYRYLLSLIIVIFLIIPIKINFKYNISKYMPWNIESNLDVNYKTSLNNKNYFISDSENSYWKENNLKLKKNKLDFNFIFKYVIPIIWLIVVIIESIILIISNIIFLRRMRNFICKDKRIYNVLENSKRSLNIDKEIKVFICNQIKVPSLFGIKNPKIFLPEIVYSLTDEELRYIIYHELCHYKRRDNWTLMIITVLKILYRFSIIIPYFLDKIKDNMEYAVDEKVIINLDDDETFNYCCTLINLSAENSEKVLLLNKFSDSKEFLRKRIRSVKINSENYKMKYILLILVIFIVVIFLIYSISNKLVINDINKILSKGFSNDKYVEIKFEYLSNNRKISNVSNYVEYKTIKYSKDCNFVLALSYWLNNVNNNNLFYKYLGNKMFDSKECAYFLIYSKTDNNFISKEILIDISTGLILKEEFFYNREKGVKPIKPEYIINYTYMDNLS